MGKLRKIWLDHSYSQILYLQIHPLANICNLRGFPGHKKSFVAQHRFPAEAVPLPRKTVALMLFPSLCFVVLNSWLVVLSIRRLDAPDGENMCVWETSFRHELSATGHEFNQQFLLNKVLLNRNAYKTRLCVLLGTLIRYMLVLKSSDIIEHNYRE